MGTHIVSIYHRTTRCLITNIGRDEVSMVPLMCIDFSSDLPWDGSRSGKNKSKMASKNFFGPEGFTWNAAIFNGVSCDA